MRLELHKSDEMLCFINRMVDWPQPCFGLVINGDISGTIKYYVEGGYEDYFKDKTFYI